MAHEIHASDRFGEVRKNGQRAWHGLGMEIEEGLTAVEAFPLIGLAWDTELLPLFAERITADGIERIESDSRLHIRSDTGQKLGTVSDGYKPFDNGDLARFADALAGLDAAVVCETAGSLYDSRRIFCSVKLPQVVRASADDVLEQYVIVSNGHGGFASFSCYPTSVRPVCANTLRWSERDLSRGLSFRHTGNFDEKVKQARTVLGIAQAETVKFQEQVTALVGAQLDESATRAFMQLAWEDAFGKLNKDTMEDATYVKLLTKRDADVETWMANIENERNVMHAGNAWGAFNAITEWHDHERGRFKGINESDARVHSNLFGTSAMAKMRTFRRALELV